MPNQFGGFQTGDIRDPKTGEWVESPLSTNRSFGDNWSPEQEQYRNAKAAPAKQIVDPRTGKSYFDYDALALGPIGGYGGDSPAAYRIGGGSATGSKDPRAIFEIGGNKYVPKEYAQFQNQNTFLDKLMTPENLFSMSLMAFGLPPVAMGAMAGAAQGSARSATGNFGDIAKGAVIGGAAGGIGQAVGGATESATLGKLASTGSKMALNNMAGGGTSPRMGSTGQQQTGGGMPQQGGGMTGGIMDNLTVGNVLGGLGGVADYATSGKQMDVMKGAYGDAQNLIMQPSPEQQQIRQQTMGMIKDPSSFFQDPLYQAAFGQGQQALERSQAGRGMAGSGGAAMELQKYGQTFGFDMYQNRLAQLSGLSGIQQDPATREMGAQTLLGGAGLQANLMGDRTRALATGAQGVFGGGSSGGTGIGGMSLGQLGSGIKDLYGMFGGSSVMPGGTGGFDPTGNYGGMDFSGMWGGTTDFTGSGTGAIGNLSDYTGTTDYSSFVSNPSDFLSSYFK